MQTHTYTQNQVKRPIIDVTAFADGPFPKVSLKHLPAGNLHRVPVVHTVWGKHTLCKWFFFWNGAHTTRNSVLMAMVSAKANGCCVCFLYVCVVLHVYVFCTVLCMHLCMWKWNPNDLWMHGGIKMQRQETRKKFFSLYIFQLIHKSGDRQRDWSHPQRQKQLLFRDWEGWGRYTKSPVSLNQQRL